MPSVDVDSAVVRWISEQIYDELYAWTQDLALQQILSSIDLFLSYRTDYTDSRTV